MKRSCALGIDLGTSAVKLIAISRDGRVVASAREPYDTIRSCEGQAEQKWEHWLSALSRAAHKIHSTRQLRVEAIGLTGQMPTLVVLHGRRPMGRAITWQDNRADNWASGRLNYELRQTIYRRTGVMVDGRYLAPMFGFHYPRRTKGSAIRSAKDFLLHALTGVSATDPSTASGYGVYNLKSGSWDQELCSFWNIVVDQLPPVLSSFYSEPLGRAGSKIVGCAPGTPVVLGCADSAAGVYALNGNVANAKTANILTGSSTVIIKYDLAPRWDKQGRFLVTPLAVDHTYGREADLLASGSAREWLQELFGRKTDKDQHSLWRSAHEIAPGANGLLFAPYLAGGEQGVLWNPNLTGTLIGLTCAHRRAHIARALLEGMSFEIRRCLDAFETKSITSVRVTGWITQSSSDLQLLADILGRPVEGWKLESASAIGAALLTGLVDQHNYFMNTKTVVLDPTKNSHCYRDLYAKYIRRFHRFSTRSGS